MSEPTLAALQARCADLERRLADPGAGTGEASSRPALKAEIIALYRALDYELASLATLKERVHALIDRWKALGPVSPAPDAASPVTVPAAPPPVRADHLGASTFLEKGWGRISAGDHAGAEEVLGRALLLTPDDPQALSLLGWAQMLQERYDEALANFQRALMRQPANALARVNLGYVCLRKGIFGEAIEHLSKAIRLDNDARATLYAHYYLGLVYLEREMFDDAQMFLRQALALGPNLIEARYQLGCALWRSGDRGEALSAWRVGATASKFNPWGRRCVEAVSRGESGEEPVDSAAPPASPTAQVEPSGMVAHAG